MSSHGHSVLWVIYAHQLRVTIGICVQDLEIITKSADEKDMENQVIYLPL